MGIWSKSCRDGTVVAFYFELKVDGLAECRERAKEKINLAQIILLLKNREVKLIHLAGKFMELTELMNFVKILRFGG